MKTLTTTLMAALAVTLVGLDTNQAEAGCGGGKYRGGYSYRSAYHYTPVVHKPLIQKVIVEKPVIVEKKVFVEKPVYIQKPVIVEKPVAVAQPVAHTTCFDPHHCHCFVRPGDTWITIAKRQYGNPNLWPFLAKFNNVAPTQQLNLGQQIQLPKINANGTMIQAPAPAPAGLPTQPGQAPLQTLNQMPAGSPAGIPGNGQQMVAPLAQQPSAS